MRKFSSQGVRVDVMNQIQMLLKRWKKKELESIINRKRRSWKNVFIRRRMLLPPRSSSASSSSLKNKKRRQEDDVRPRTERSLFPLCRTFPGKNI